VIINSVLSGLCDRIASQVEIFKYAINSGVGNGNQFYPRIHQGVGANGDYAVEDALIDAAYGLDTNTVSGTMFRSLYSDMITSIESYVQDIGAEDLDEFLNTSGVNVHPSFEDVYYQSRGVHLDAVNVFFAEPNLLVATYTVTGSGTGTYASVEPVGTGTGKFDKDSNRAAARFILVPNQNVTSTIQLNPRLVREDGVGGTTAGFDNIRLATGITSGTQILLNSGVGIGWLNCNNIVAAGGGGTDVFSIFALQERKIFL
jgi:hypothetical protein